jgi:hypothetical protein
MPFLRKRRLPGRKLPREAGLPFESVLAISQKVFFPRATADEYRKSVYSALTNSI